MKLTLTLPRDKAENLFQAIKSGQFESYGAVDAELKEVQKTVEAVHTSTTGYSEFSREIHWERLQDHEYRQEVMGGLVCDYADAIRRYCTIRLGEELAEEVAQDVFITAWERFPRLQSNVSLQTWLLSIARIKCQQLVRNRSCRQAITSSLLEDIRLRSHAEPPLSPEYMIEEESQLTRLRDALSKMRDSDRILLTLYYLKELSSRDIAEVMGIPVNAVRQRIHRVRVLLREMMRDRE